MSRHTDTLTHAHITRPNPNLTGSTTDRGEVKSVAIFERQPRRQSVQQRAWDEMSEIDRAVLLETVRLRRKAREQRRKLHQQHYGKRTTRRVRHNARVGSFPKETPDSCRVQRLASALA